MTQLGDYDSEKEVIVACPASALANSKRFKKAYTVLYPDDKFHFIYNKNCLHRYSKEPFIQRTYHIAKNDVYILTPNDVHVVNTVGIEGLYNVSFYKVTKDCAYCLGASSCGRHLEIDKDRFILQELQKKYDIPDDVLWKLEGESHQKLLTLQMVRGKFDSESEEEMTF
jgi:hypothetical protein